VLNRSAPVRGFLRRASDSARRSWRVEDMRCKITDARDSFVG
jgi:hypothetical protein